MAFKLGDRVSVIGCADPKTVESANGDDVAVLEYDPERNLLCRRTYKAAMLQFAPKRRAIGASF
jgi:hypothetical protein